MMRLVAAIACIALFILPDSLYAQEMLFGLSHNQQIVDYHKTNPAHLLKGSRNDTLELPFFDDFSYPSIFPDTLLWEDKDAFVNTSYPINPPSIGVVTLDAIDDNGLIYNVSNPEYFIADALTSRHINLDYPVDSNIYFSFYYQPQGRGNEPEVIDSLVLEFSTGNNDWYRVWSIEGSENHDFKRVLLPITDTLFLTDAFQFRFLNYVSINNTSVPGNNANADQWHIDYIFLDKQRSEEDTILNDITFIYPLESAVFGYEAIPWDHFLSPADPNYTHNNTIYLVYTNRDTAIRKATSLIHVTDLIGNAPFEDFLVRESNLFYNEIIYVDQKTGTFPFESNNSDNGIFEIKGILDIDEEYDFAGNDTTTYYQQFEDYYAYDDGSAENGYGVIGNNVQIAYQFETLKEDNLQAVKIHFNHIVNDYTDNKFFYLRVWDDNEGLPGDTIHHQQGYSPDYADSLNGYITYYLDKELAVSGTFYVGWEQTTNDFINVGFDVNRDASDKIFYNINGGWQNTGFTGALMIRPVFGDFIVDVKEVAEIHKTLQVLVYPNPAREYISIQSHDNQADLKMIILYDKTGRVLYSDSYRNSPIDTRHLAPGLYFIKVLTESGAIGQQKFIIAK